MTTYKGNALHNQDSRRVGESKREHRARMQAETADLIALRESKATDRAAGEAYERESDDGRADEAHPDASWVEGFNAGQRGES